MTKTREEGDELLRLLEAALALADARSETLVAALLAECLDAAGRTAASGE